MTDDEVKTVLTKEQLTDFILDLNRENRVLFDLLRKAGVIHNPNLEPIRVV